jgi:hypothetical protein
MSLQLIKPDLIKSVDFIYNEQTYPARSIVWADAPEWYYRQEDTKTVQRQFDRTFELVMFSSDLAVDIDNRMACHGHMEAQYANAIITSKTGDKAAIKDASLLYFKGLDITLLGGVFVFVGNELWTRQDFEQHKKRLEKIEDEKPYLARFRQILEE